MLAGWAGLPMKGMLPAVHAQAVPEMGPLLPSSAHRSLLGCPLRRAAPVAENPNERLGRSTRII